LNQTPPGLAKIQPNKGAKNTFSVAKLQQTYAAPAARPFVYGVILY